MLRLIALRLMESYFRHRWLYLVPIIMMLWVASAFFFLTKPKYIANGIIYVQKESLLARLTSVKDPGITWQTPAIVTMGELNELLQTDAFIRAVISQTDLEGKMDQGSAVVNDTIDKVRSAVWVGSIGSNQVRVSAIYEQPQVASQLANATIVSFVQWKINADKTDSEAAHTFFTDIIAKYKADLDLARQNMNDYLLAHPEPIKGQRPIIEQLEIKRLQSEMDLNQARYASALNKDEDARLAASQAESDARQSYVIIDAPRMPDKPDVSLKQTIIKMLVFVVVGVFLSGVGIVGAAVLDRSFRFPVDVWQGINLPVLAMIPDGSRLPMRKKLKRVKKGKEADQQALETEEKEIKMIPAGSQEERGFSEKEVELVPPKDWGEPESTENEVELSPTKTRVELESTEKRVGLKRNGKRKGTKAAKKEAEVVPANNQEEDKFNEIRSQETKSALGISDEINPEAMKIFEDAFQKPENNNEIEHTDVK